MKQYDETKFNYKAKLALEYMVDSLNEAHSEAAKYKELAEQNWKIQPFKPYLRDTFEFTWQKPDGYYGAKRDVKGRWSATYWGDDMELKTTVEEITKMKASDLITQEENKVIAAQNANSFKKLTDLMTTMGISFTMDDPKSRKSWNKPKVRRDFAREIESQCKTHQPPAPDWEGIERAINARVEKKRLAELEIEKKKVVEESEKKKNKVILGLVKKYDLAVDEGMPEAEDILDELLGKDKYLHLAHYLEKNRGDWTDGYSYAETGLGGFEFGPDSPTYEIDKLIYEDISSRIGENWDGDGRTFRDSPYGYDTLFGMVNEEIYKDYAAIKEFIKEY